MEMYRLIEELASAAQADRQRALAALARAREARPGLGPRPALRRRLAAGLLALAARLDQPVGPEPDHHASAGRRRPVQPWGPRRSAGASAERGW